ncbi:hypothetical protein [Hymenobacter volaticus]|uniref:Uncharacterized protein n=1 Tax=Hymenobacter volaticus TaxID=2932254 RepID=A0ABY4G6F6_9BACT|nr:hypothetical protein [Hymenobacter volaticus]UOQ66473.1 hypothetical protein MUN86_00615 [Hymenobacter volaticus]
MKKLYTIALFSLLFLLGGHAHGISITADTLRGQRQLVQHVSQTVCSKLADEDKKSPLSKLSPADAQSLFAEVLQSSIREHIDEMSALMTINKINNPRKFGEVVGREVVLLMVKDCPISQPLIMSIGMAQVKNLPTITAEEKPVLMIVSTEICQRLDTENAKNPIINRSIAERKEVMQTVMQGAVLKHIEALSNYYGFKAIGNKVHMEGVGRKIAMLMADQCPNYLTQMGFDAIAK